jgi:hypothetical protein
MVIAFLVVVFPVVVDIVVVVSRRWRRGWWRWRWRWGGWLRESRGWG